MRILHGLLPGQILQRDNTNTGSANISGVCTAAGDIECRVLSGDNVLSGYDWQVVGRSANQTFEAGLSNVPVGGPYRVELRLTDASDTPECVRIDDIYVGDVWILAGQSNMEGFGNMKDAPEPHPLVRAFYMRDEWGLAQEKLHLLQEAVDSFHNGYGNGPDRPSEKGLGQIRQTVIKGVGPGLGFGLEMRRRSGVPQGLIACAHGGTSMAQWSPALRDQGGASLYGAMLRRYETLGQPVAGILWYQGESDANAESAAVYTEKMKDLVAATRRDLRLPDLPWMIVQLGCHIALGGEHWNNIQEQQRRLPEKINRLDVAPAVDLGLDDDIHISGKDQQVLGKRLARIADRLVHGNLEALPGITLEAMEMVPTPDTHKNCPNVSMKLIYMNVAGALTSPGLPTGFVLVDEAGNDVPGIFKTTLEDNTVLLHTGHSKFQLSRLGVSYGHGRYPYCNITDAEGMSIPVMRAVMIDPDHAPACTRWETARLSDMQTVEDVDLSMIQGASSWADAPPRLGFGFLPKPADDPQPGTFAMRTRITASEPLTGRFIFGANAPFKMWLNETLVTQDTTAGPPLNPEQYQIDIPLIAGENSLVVAITLPGPGAHLGINTCIGTPAGKKDRRISV